MDPLHLGIVIVAVVTVVIVVVLLVRRRAEKTLPPPAEEPVPEAEEERPAEAVAVEEPEPEAEEERPAEAVAVEEPEKESALQRILSIRRGLKATRGGFVSRLRSIFKGRTELTEDVTESIEEVLITSDVGTRTAQIFIDRIQESLPEQDMGDVGKVWQFIREESLRMLAVDVEPAEVPEGEPRTILVLGVNGVGKTTTIGKLAARYLGEGRKVLLAAGDTFRAAAVEQLEIWGQRIGCPVVKGKQGADPSSVVFDAIKQAQEQGIDDVIVDTAGRLHTKTPLMEELKKIRRVMGKAQAGAPHEVFLVLDATTGQNGVMQARTFLSSLDVTGIVLTKLDGTAKGGVILGISQELRIPVRYIGVGEGVDDLRPFDPEEFVAAMFDDIEDEDAAA
jgi:fused signal recognition particle receptor